jgi:hypothetical protein
VSPWAAQLIKGEEYMNEYFTVKVTMANNDTHTHENANINWSNKEYIEVVEEKGGAGFYKRECVMTIITSKE